MTNIVTPNANINVVQVTSPGPLGPRGPQGVPGERGTVEANSGFIATPYLNVSGSMSVAGPASFSGSVVITGSLIVSSSNTFINIGPARFSGSVNISGSLTAAEFTGSGAGLTNIPASAISGLNLSRIATGNISASVSAGGTSFTLNNGASNLFTVNSSGLGTFLNGLTVNGSAGTFNQGLSVSNGATLNGGTTVNTSLTINGTATLNGSALLTAGNLSTDKITSGNVSASVSTGGNSFTVDAGATNLLTVTNAGQVKATLFSGSGASLSNIPASAISGLNLSQIATGSVTSSVSTTGKLLNLVSSGTSIFSVDASGNISGSGLFVSGSAIYMNGPDIRLYGNATLNDAAITTTATTTTDRIQSGTITASVATFGNAFTLQSAGARVFEISTAGILSGSGANLSNIPASGITGLNLSRTATGSVSASVNIGSTSFEIVSGSSTLMSLDYTGKLTVSKSINAGVPTSNQWQSGLNGSYFNNFTSTSDVSEILRFIAGLLSSSAPDASPNTKNYGNVTENISSNSTTTAPSGYVPQSSTTADLIYLTGKGFTSAGNTLFSGKTIYNNSAYSISYSSVAGGSTNVSSSVDAELFGLGTLSSGNATPLYVSGTINWFYSDNNTETVTATSQSQNLLSNSSFGTSNGLTVAKILTANPAVIPPAYQDGKFATVFSSGLYNANRSFTSVSSSGWYHISASIVIATGSSTYSPAKTATERIFWAPISNITIPSQTITFSGVGNNALTATSRSLSGAPYLLTSTFNFASTVNGVFNPMYTADSTVASMTEADSLVTTTGTASVSTSGGTVQTTTAVFDSTGATPRTVGTVPFETDIIKMTGSATFDAGNAGSTNISSTGLGTTSFVLTHAGKNRSGASTTGTQTISYHTAGTFAQPSASGSLAYYGRTSQTYDGGSLTGQTEAFTGEAYRIQLNDNVTTFTGNAWNNSFGLYNLGAKDLQVKPGYLVKPGGTYKYWLNDPSPADTFKYYIRRYQRTSVLTSFTLNVGKTLVPWDDVSTSNSVAVGIIFESAKGGASNCRIFDPVYANGSRGVTYTGGTAGTNPFTSALDYYGAGGSSAGTTYTITVSSTTGMVLNGTGGSDEIYVIIRYNGDPSPVTSLTVSGT